MIESIAAHNLDEVLPLVREYQMFYQVADICDAKNKQFFAQFGEHNPNGCQFGYRHEGRMVGFATLYFTFNTSVVSKVAVLNDLFTLPDQRGRGVGRALIEHCLAYAKVQGAARLQWVTSPDNARAQRLYDSLNTRQSVWHFYTLSDC